MCRFFAIVLVAFATTFAGCGGGGGSSPKGTVDGAVRTSLGVRLSGATVTCAGVRADCDSSGYYQLRDVPVGSQIVTAGMQGYIDAEGRGTTSVYVTEGRTVTATDLYLAPFSGSSVYLADINPSHTDFVSGQVSLNGVTYLHSISGYVWGDEAVMTYPIGKQYTRFQSKIGVLDTEGNVDRQVIFVIIADITEIYRSTPLKVGAAVDVDLPVAGVLILQIKVLRVVSNLGLNAALGDPKLVK